MISSINLPFAQYVDKLFLINSEALSKFKLRPIKDHYRGTFENFDIEKQKVREW